MVSSIAFPVLTGCVDAFPFPRLFMDALDSALGAGSSRLKPEATGCCGAGAAVAIFVREVRFQEEEESLKGERVVLGSQGG